ncbi:DNA methyltransferase [Mycolicibacterium phage phi1_186001]
MNNPELRAVLTEALSRSYYRIVGSSSDCRVDPGEILADAVLSLPGVAVIQLPKPTEAVTMQDCAGSGKPFKPATLSRDGEVAKCSACGTNRYVRDDGSIEPHQVPVAAVVAEGEDK